jgi:flagellar biosynthesis/type III secretory pathway protein FliH
MFINGGMEVLYLGTYPNQELKKPTNSKSQSSTHSHTISQFQAHHASLNVTHTRYEGTQSKLVLLIFKKIIDTYPAGANSALLRQCHVSRNK